MAVVEEAVRARLAASTGVGDKAGDRIYPVQSPSSALVSDHVTYQRISTIYNPSHEQGQQRYHQARIQVDSWSQTYAGAKDLAEEVRKAMDGYSGSTGGILTYHVSIVRDQDLFEGEGGEDTWHRVSQDYRIEARATT